jgi:metal-sulfur cluster biosynthetic enzyme
MPWSKEPEVLLDIKAVGASRAMYVDEETQRVRVTFTTTDNQIVAMELTPHQAARLIEQTTSAYYAIVPQLKTSRGIPF